MRTPSLVILGALLVALCSGSASADFIDASALAAGVTVAPPRRMGNQVVQSVRLDGDNGKKMHLEFQVEHHPDLISLDDGFEFAPHSVVCEGESMRLTFHSQDAAAAAVARGLSKTGTVLAGSRKWGCTNAEGTAASILRKVVRLVGNSDKSVLVEVVPAGFEDAFVNADVKFTTSLYPKGHFSEKHFSEEGLQRRFLSAEMLPEESESVENLVSIGSFLKNAWAGVKDALTSAERSLKAIFGVTKDLTKGDLEVSKKFIHDIFNFNYDRASGRAASVLTPFSDFPLLKCDNCFADFDLEVEFVLSVAKSKLNRLRTTVAGVVGATAEASISLESAVSRSFRRQIAEIAAQPITFTIAGVPFVIEIIVPIELGIDVSASGSASVTAGVGADSFLRFGFDYQGESWDNAWIVEHDISHHEEKPAAHLGSADAAMTVSLFPNLLVKVDHIGGPTLGLRLFSTFTASSTDMDTCPAFFRLGGGDDALSRNLAQGQSAMTAIAATLESPSSLNVPFLTTVDAGTQVLLGALVDVKISGKQIVYHEFEPLSIYSIVRRIAEDCLSLPLPELPFAIRSQPTSVSGYNGRVWYADAVHCSSFPGSGPVALQMVGDNQLVLAINDVVGPCSGQMVYEMASEPKPNSVIVASRVDFDNVDVVSCRAGSMSLAPPKQITLEFGAAVNQVRLIVADNCSVNMK